MHTVLGVPFLDPSQNNFLNLLGHSSLPQPPYQPSASWCVSSSRSFRFLTIYEHLPRTRARENRTTSAGHSSQYHVASLAEPGKRCDDLSGCAREPHASQSPHRLRPGYHLEATSTLRSSKVSRMSFAIKSSPGRAWAKCTVILVC